jgi:DNA invertase Pin-like site-specific DNA recombinase
VDRASGDRPQHKVSRGTDQSDDGRKRAKARGVRFGRPQGLTAHQRKEVIQRLAEGAVQADLARSYGVSQATISRLAAPSPFAEGAAVAQ